MVVLPEPVAPHSRMVSFSRTQACEESLPDRRHRRERADGAKVAVAGFLAVSATGSSASPLIAPGNGLDSGETLCPGLRMVRLTVPCGTAGGRQICSRSPPGSSVAQSGLRGPTSCLRSAPAKVAMSSRSASVSEISLAPESALLPDEGFLRPVDANLLGFVDRPAIPPGAA